MLSLVDLERGTLRLYPIITFDVIYVVLLAALIARRVIPSYPSALVGVLVLVLVNSLLVWHALRQSFNPPREHRIPKLLWFAAAVFTPAAIAALLAWVNKPDLQSTIQVIVAALLVGYIWFLVFCLNRNKTENLP